MQFKGKLILVLLVLSTGVSCDSHHRLANDLFKQTDLPQDSVTATINSALYTWEHSSWKDQYNNVVMDTGYDCREESQKLSKSFGKDKHSQVEFYIYK